MKWIIASLVIALCSCNQQIVDDNPPAMGFDSDNSDARAVAIADEVMVAMGGREAWDRVESISWTFFGRRSHEWNKIDGRNTMKIPSDSLVVEHAIDGSSGTVTIGSVVQSHPDTIAKYIDFARSAWINDSYWLVMPYKLKDSGVTLRYQDEIYFAEDRPADRLLLTFDAVGDTPENAYLVTVPRDTKLVEQWDFYREASDTVPAFATQWQDYKQYGDILLSGDRGDYQLTDIAVSMRD